MDPMSYVGIFGIGLFSTLLVILIIFLIYLVRTEHIKHRALNPDMERGRRRPLNLPVLTRRQRRTLLTFATFVEQGKLALLRERDDEAQLEFRAERAKRRRDELDGRFLEIELGERGFDVELQAVRNREPGSTYV